MAKPKASKNKAKDVEKMPRQPNNTQALQLIDQACAMAPLNRQAHIQVQQALQQINSALSELELLKKKG